MPLIKTFDIDVKTKLYLWDVEEKLTDLQQAVVLTPQQQESLNAIHNEKGKKTSLLHAFCSKISVIHLLLCSTILTENLSLAMENKFLSVIHSTK